MTNISTQKERILQFIDFKGITKNKFYVETGISNGVLDKKSGLSMETVEKFYNRYPEINPEWLITGNGEMIKRTDQENASITKDSKEIYSPKLIPLYDGVITAGQMEVDMTPLSEPVELIDAGDWFRDATAAMRIHGDSMSPNYHSGSIAALKEVKDKTLLIYGEDYVIETLEYRTIKRIQRGSKSTEILLCSANNDRWEDGSDRGRLIYEPFPVEIDSIRRIFQVLGSVRRNHSSRIVYNSK
ncbi:MAG: peptidase S24 [Chryseobacterium gambrini]|nr:peptidase S24 [Chryseobacterium gambrini]